jgi:integrase
VKHAKPNPFASVFVSYAFPAQMDRSTRTASGKISSHLRSSKGLVPLIPALRVILEAHRLRVGNPSTGPIFATANGTPVSLNNLLNDKILPALRRCINCGKAYDKVHIGHEYQRDESWPDWKGFHAFRRFLASNLNSLGVEDLTVQKILRHSSVETTRRAYIRVLPSASVSAMSRLEVKLASTTIQ